MPFTKHVAKKFRDKANQSPSHPYPSTERAKGEFSVIGLNVLNQDGVNASQIANLLVYNASVEYTAYY